MLSIVLLGIGAGGLAASRWSARDAAAHRWVPAVAFLAGVAAISTYVSFDRFLVLLGADYSQTPRATFVESCWLMLAVCFASGILFTLMGRALRDDVADVTRATGLLTLANTTGAMLGGPLAGFVLLPGLGMERSFFVLALAYGAVAVLAWGTEAVPEGRPRIERRSGKTFPHHLPVPPADRPDHPSGDEARRVPRAAHLREPAPGRLPASREARAPRSVALPRRRCRAPRPW